MSKRGRLLDDCFLHDKDRLRHDECLSLILERLGPVVETETLPIGKVHGRILAETVTAPRDVPLHTNSAVDGFAFAHTATSENDVTLLVSARVAAGDLAPPLLKPGTAARIFTGAPLPDGADTVIMQEDCSIAGDGTSVTIPGGLKRGANIRKAGEDIRKGDPVLAPGSQLRPQDIAALASLGKAAAAVHEQIRVALVSSGDELVQPGKPINSGQVYDSNRTMIAALAASLPVHVTDIGVIGDDFKTVEAKLREVAENHHLIITSGGASRGEEDHVVDAIDALGNRHLWQIAIKPGRPMIMGQIGNCVIMGLPGNPVAAFVCFLLYCRPAIVQLGGGTWREPFRYQVPAGFSVPKKKPDRREFWRAWLEPSADGQPVARKFERDGSGLISGLREATGLIEVAEDVTSVKTGDLVHYIPFSEMGISPAGSTKT